MNEYKLFSIRYLNMNEYVQIISQTTEQIISRFEYQMEQIFVFIWSQKKMK